MHHEGSHNRHDGRGDRDLISVSRVCGTDVFDGAGKRIGSVSDIMLRKRDGDVAYAVLSIGGFLGIGARYNPLPWDALSYDQALGGYSLDAETDVLADAPNYGESEIADYRWDRGLVDTHYETATTRGALRRRRSTAFLPGAPTAPLGNVVDGGLSGGAGVSGAHRHGGATGSMGTGGMTGDGSGRI